MYLTKAGEALNEKQSKELMKLCLQEASYFTLVVWPDHEEMWKYHNYDREFEKSMQPYCVGDIRIPNGTWGCYYAGYKIKIFEITEKSAEELLKFHESIYLEWDVTIQREMEDDDYDGEDDVPLNTLSDIAFLDKNKRIMVETEPHEGYVGIYEGNKTLIDFVQRNPEVWRRSTHDYDNGAENVIFEM